MQNHKKVSVVIPSWNSEKQMQENLPFVFRAAEKVDAEIVIIDDASQYDKSYEYIKSQKKIRSYRNETNLGFSATVNRGVELSKGDIIMLLNTDVRPDPDCFVNALKFFDDPTVYSVGFNSGEAWMGAKFGQGLLHHFKVEPNENNKNKINKTCWASGGQAAFDRKKWLALGGMDLLYKPFYWEDTDMGYRSWKRGWQNLWAPNCHCVHDHQKSVIATNFTKEFVMATAQRNQFLFIWKNISDLKYLLTHILYLPYYLVKYPLPVLRALLMLPNALGARIKESKYWVRSDRDILEAWSQ